MSKSRKDDHIRLALKQEITTNSFDKISLEHTNLSNLRLNQIDLSSNFLGIDCQVPFYINAITGGSENAKVINNKLAKLARLFNIPMMVGSQMIAIKDAKWIDSFKVVRENFDGIVIANISANASVADALNAINMIDANGLAIHLNVIQELVMPEGDRDFSSWLDNIINISNNVNIPVMVKEVGFGLSINDINKLNSHGIKYFDISGKGGTNFAVIEGSRSDDDLSCFDSLGIDTVDLLVSLNKINKNYDLYCSGGVRNELDVIKSLVLGAKMVGLSNWFLKLTLLEDDEAIKRIETFILNIKKLMLIVGARNINELRGVTFKV